MAAHPGTRCSLRVSSPPAILRSPGCPLWLAETRASQPPPGFGLNTTRLDATPLLTLVRLTFVMPGIESSNRNFGEEPFQPRSLPVTPLHPITTSPAIRRTTKSLPSGSPLVPFAEAGARSSIGICRTGCSARPACGRSGRATSRIAERCGWTRARRGLISARRTGPITRTESTIASLS